MFVELKTDTRGAAWMLACLAGLNILDMQRDPALLARVNQLLSQSDPPGFAYRRESPDVWTSIAVDVWRAQELAAGRRGSRAHLPESRICSVLAGAPGDFLRPIGIDCEDIAATICAWAVCSGRYRTVRACVTQPHGHGVCHAYSELDGEIVDGAAIYGMRSRSGHAPPLDWYRQSETAMFDVAVPTPSFLNLAA